MAPRETAAPLPGPLIRLLAVFAALRILVRVVAAEVREAKAGLGPLLPAPEEYDRLSEAHQPTLPMRLEADADVLLERLASVLALAEVALRNVEHGVDEPEEDHDTVMTRLAAAMADPASPAGETLRRLRELLAAGDGPADQAKLESERIQSGKRDEGEDR